MKKGGAFAEEKLRDFRPRRRDVRVSPERTFSTIDVCRRYQLRQTTPDPCSVVRQIYTNTYLVYIIFVYPFYRAILESIERELRAGNGTAPASTPGAPLLSPAAASAIALAPGTTEKAGEPAMSLSSRLPPPHAFPQAETETPKKVSSAGSARKHPALGRTLGEEPRLRRRRAETVQWSTGQSATRASGTSDNTGKSGKSAKQMFDGDGRIHSTNRKGPPGANFRPLQSGKPVFGGSIHSSNRKKGPDVVLCRRVTGMTVSAKRGSGGGGGSGTRSTGTAVAHFPTAVAATARSRAQDKAAARRSRA